METIDLSKLSSAQIAEILKKKKEEENEQTQKKRDAYEGIRADMVARVEQKVRAVTIEVKNLFFFVKEETQAFFDVMKEYGQLKRNEQMSYSIQSENFKIEVKTNKVKKFDERADIAAGRLIEFLRAWISDSQKGTNDPMYQLAMTLIERNKEGDLDYKSISKLYDLEAQFNDPDYTEIMKLFKESNVIEGTATNFYFYEKNDLAVWKKIEPSFNRM